MLKMGEFNLSDEITKCGLCSENFQQFLRVEDVREFIKLLKEDLSDECDWAKVDRLAGEKLI